MQNTNSKQQKVKLLILDLVILPVLADIMFLSKLLMEGLPNVHLIGVFVVAITVVYRAKALWSIYIFVFLTGLFNGFCLWWYPYLYIWTLLWAVVMILPKNMPKKVSYVVYITVCGLHGFLYGTIYAPVQALIFGLDFKGTIAWIIAGLPWDVAHGISNLFGGLLIIPIIEVLNLLIKPRSKQKSNI